MITFASFYDKFGSDMEIASDLPRKAYNRLECIYITKYMGYCASFASRYISEILLFSVSLKEVALSLTR